MEAPGDLGKTQILEIRRRQPRLLFLESLFTHLRRRRCIIIAQPLPCLSFQQ